MTFVPALVVEKAVFDESDGLHATIVGRFLVVRADSGSDIIDRILEVFKIDGSQHGIVNFARWP
jgi:hypothetical protein